MMKSKTLITIVLASFIFAIYALFSNIQKAKNEIYHYSAVTVYNQPATPQMQSGGVTKQGKRARTRGVNVPDNSFQSSIRPDKNSGGISNSGTVASGSLTKGVAGRALVTPRKDDANTANNTAQGMLVTQAGSAGRGGSATTLADATGVTSSFRGTQLTSVATLASSSPMMKNSANTNDGMVVVVDPGLGDPKGNPMPIGDGLYALMALIGVYMGVKKLRAK